MANMNLKVTIATTGVAQQISKSLPSRSGGTGNLQATLATNQFADAGNIFVQWITLQNQGSNVMHVGDATTTATNGLSLTASGSVTATTAINYGTYLSDWWVVGTAGDVLFVLYIQ